MNIICREDSTVYSSVGRRKLEQMSEVEIREKVESRLSGFTHPNHTRTFFGFTLGGQTVDE